MQPVSLRKAQDHVLVSEFIRSVYNWMAIGFLNMDMWNAQLSRKISSDGFLKIRKGMEVGAFDYVLKTITPEELAYKIWDAHQKKFLQEEKIKDLKHTFTDTEKNECNLAI